LQLSRRYGGQEPLSSGVSRMHRFRTTDKDGNGTMTRLKLTPTEYSNFLRPPPELPFTQLREAAEKALDKWALDANGFVTEYKPRVRSPYHYEGDQP